MRSFRTAVGLALALLGLLGAASLVSAHARYDRSDPAADSVVASAPTQLRVWFTQELVTRGSRLEVLDAAGNRVDQDDSRVDLNDPDRKLMLVTLMPLADGVYTVNWRSVSAEDGDDADGSFRFGVGASTTLGVVQ